MKRTSLAATRRGPCPKDNNSLSHPYCKGDWSKNQDVKNIKGDNG